MSRAVTRAEALLGAGELEAAEALFRDAVAQDPEDLLAAKGLAQALDRMRRFDEAFDAWETTLRIAPDDVICQYALGDAWQRRGDVERSRKIFERIRDAHPNFYPAYAMTLLSMLYSDKASAVEIKSEQQRWGRF
ncbi:MAG: tetratricopeptide repeat protein, partial [Rhodospirillaceae bacterium]|nr:tetratricopeptide repeat protein [Rhodospirillaceae bacterium]